MALASALSQAHHGEPLSSLLPVPWCDRPGTGDRASMPRELLLSLEWPGCAAGLQRGAGGGRPRRPDGRSALPEHPDVGRFFLPLVLVLVLGALAFPAQREGFLAAVGPSWPWGPGLRSQDGLQWATPLDWLPAGESGDLEPPGVAEGKVAL